MSTRRVAFWWRDDDVQRPGPKLDRLLNLSQTWAVPLFLAAIPAGIRARPREAAHLARIVGQHPHARIVLHGYAHVNHAPEGERASEYPASRDRGEILAEIRQGRDILEQGFAGNFLPVFVPPWNRIGPACEALVFEAGLKVLSCARAWPDPEPAHLCSVHLDPIDWRGRSGPARRYRGRARMHDWLQSLVTHARGTGASVGVLSHHCDHDGEGWRFLAALARFVHGHPHLGWIDPFAGFAARSGGR